MKSAVTLQDKLTIYIVTISISMQGGADRSVREKAFGSISQDGYITNPIMESTARTDMNWI